MASASIGSIYSIFWYILKQGVLRARRRAASCGESGGARCRALREVQAWRSPHVDRNPKDGTKLLTFFNDDVGLKRYRCACSPDNVSRVGMDFFNAACHLASRKHWKHWRLVAFGEAQPSEAEWQAFAASMPLAPTRAVRRT